MTISYLHVGSVFVLQCFDISAIRTVAAPGNQLEDSPQPKTTKKKPPKMKQYLQNISFIAIVHSKWEIIQHFCEL